MKVKLSNGQVWGVISVCAIILVTLIGQSAFEKSELAAIPAPTQLAQVTSATLALSPSSSAVNVGNQFTVNIMLNTGGQDIYGVDVNRLRYPTALLQVVDVNANISGTQIAGGSLMAQEFANAVDIPNGNIQFSQVATPGTTYRGSGILATVTFRAIAAGTANVTLDYTAGSGTDCNIAGASGDILTAVTNGSYTLTVVDNTAPTISNIALSNITTTGTTISWSTNEQADTRVEYGLTTSYGSFTTLNSSMTLTHSATISGLSPATSYHYRVISKDAANNTATSPDNVFTTLAGPDTTAPSVPTGLKATPTDETHIQLSWNASTDTAAAGQTAAGVDKYEIYRGGTLLTTTQSTAYLDSGLTAGTAYSYQVAAVDLATPANTSAKTAAVTATTPTLSLAVQRRIIIVLEGAPATKRDITGIVEFLHPTTLAKVYEGNITTDPLGRYTMSVPSGLISPVTMKPIITGYLSKTLANIDLRNSAVVDVTFPTLPAGDFVVDKQINTVDFSYMNSHWSQNDPLADINRDGEVNTLDFAYLSKNWMVSGE